MKRIVLFAALVMLALNSMAQAKSVLGKWKLSSFSSDGVVFNVDNPAQAKADMRKQFEGSGETVDTTMINAIVNSIMESLGNMTFEFTKEGKLFVEVPAAGKTNKEEENYTIDYTKGEIKSTGKEKEQLIKFVFKGEALELTMEEMPGKTNVMTLKKVK